MSMLKDKVFLIGMPENSAYFKLLGAYERKTN